MPSRSLAFVLGALLLVPLGFACRNESTGPDTALTGLLRAFRGPALYLRCEGDAQLATPRMSAWASTSSGKPDTASVVLRRSASQRTCGISVRTTTRSHATLTSVAWIADTLLSLGIVAQREGLGTISFVINGDLAGELEVFAASDAFAAAGVGHRGAGLRWPENTLAALRAAAAAHLPASEVDVRLTRDSVPVLLHDSRLERTTTGQGDLETLSLADVRTADAGVRFDPAFTGERIPTLQEALELARTTRHPLILDVKYDQRIVTHEVEAALIVRLVREAGVEELVTLLSPEPKFLRAARLESEGIGLAVLVGSAYLPHHLWMVDQARADLIMYPPDSLLHPRTLDALDSFALRGVGIAASTTNRPALADSLLQYGRASLILTGVPPRIFDYRP